MLFYTLGFISVSHSFHIYIIFSSAGGWMCLVIGSLHPQPLHNAVLFQVAEAQMRDQHREEQHDRRADHQGQQCEMEDLLIKVK